MDAMRERTLVGVFVLIAAGLLIGTMIVISGAMGGATVPHRVYFKYAGGVQPGTPVRYGGMMVGKVQRVRVDPGNTSRIELEVTVNRDAPLKTDSVAKITTLGPLTDNYIEITTGSEHAALTPPGSALRSVEAFGLSDLGDAAQAMLPDVQKALQKLNQNLDGLQVTLTRVNDLLNDRNRANIDSSLNNLQHLIADVRPKLSTSLTNVQELTAKLAPILDDLKTTTAQANDTLAHVDSTLMENRPDIRTSVTGLRDTVAKSTVLLNELNQTLDTNSANIDEILANMRMTTENLRVLTETVMRSPASLIRGVKVADRNPGDIQK